MSNKYAVLVSGWSGPGLEWRFSPIRTTLQEKGFRTVHFHQCSNGWGDIEHNGRKLGRLIDALTPSGDVYLIGHSMGGLVARVGEGTAVRPIQGAVTIGTPHGGVDLGRYAFFSTSARQMATGSEFLKKWDKIPPMSPYMSLVCQYDGIVRPIERAEWQYAQNDYVKHTHLSVIYSKNVAHKIHSFFQFCDKLDEVRESRIHP
jgi:pimeloyl-ACP methyl ester carboxylesterase